MTQTKTLKFKMTHVTTNVIYFVLFICGICLEKHSICVAENDIENTNLKVPFSTILNTFQKKEVYA